MSSHPPDVERAPTVVVQPNTPPVATQVVDFGNVSDHHSFEHDSLQVPLASIHEKHHHDSPREAQPKSQIQILTALAIGAPLIASVVSSCTSVICADLTATLGADPSQRPARASAVVALLWSALITSLGSTMTAVAGLAIHCGYHDSHVGITKRIVRFLRRRWKREVPIRDIHHDHGKIPRTPSPHPPHSVLSAITDGHKEVHEFASFRSAVVSARLLGTSVALHAMAMAVYLFLLYPLSVAVSTVVVGLITAAVTVLPLLPILIHSTS